ncbi:MAG: AMP-binding protein [Pseudonocardia sp.]|nr:AMP-binding protein [Pseudonocardia sp.]ODU27277.1 MAG: AMP-dependent synthetase [Pseudonocardia sp. SCN 72-51]ODV08890.1 MAG: AMP-dependent synthetase [Pseudonocardia sp. SCN 73-27]
MTISLVLDVAQAMNPDRVALGAGADTLDTTRLRRLAHGGASVLRARRVGTVSFVGVNSPAFPVTLFAGAVAAVPVAPLNYRLAAAQLRDLVARLDRPLVVADEEFVPALDGVGAEVVTTGRWLELAAESDVDDGPGPDDDDPAVLLFTSGTTSEPKCVILRHRNLESYVFGTVEPGSASVEEAALVSVPPYHVAGVGTVLTNLWGGRRLLYLSNFTAAEWVRTVVAEGVTFAMVVPTMLARIVDELDATGAAVPGLRSLAYGGAPMTPAVLERAMDLMPQVDFVNAYGLTETSSTIAVLGPDDHRTARGSVDPAVRARLRSVGRLIPGIEGAVRDDDGAELPPGQAGQLWVRGSQVSGEYAGSGPGLDAHGWFDTHDRAFLDADGFLYIEGRTDDVIIRGGENIAPSVIEDVIAELAGVSEVAVLGVPDPEWGERIAAVVVPRAGVPLTALEVETWARARLRGSRTPDEIHLRSELPRNEMGKIVRRSLRAELAT